MAAVWKAPVVFVCENNQYMEYTPIGDVTAVARPAADRAAAYGLEPIVVDGNDAEAVYEVAQRTLERARNGEGPSLVEALTYRHGGHSRADPGKYRPDDEVKAWLARTRSRDYRARLVEDGVDEAELDAIDAEPRPRPSPPQRPRPARPRSRRRTSSRPRSGPTEARRGGADLPRREALGRMAAPELRYQSSGMNGWRTAWRS